MREICQSNTVAKTLIVLLDAIVICACGVAGTSKSNVALQKNTPAAETEATRQEYLRCEGNPECPANVWLVMSRGSKPPFTFYQFKIRLRNRQSRPSWLLLRHRDPLVESGRFNCYDSEKLCFSGEQLAETKSKRQAKMVIIRFLGSDSFAAIRIPEGGDLTHGEYIMNIEGSISEFEVWEVDSLLVNGKTPVEEWLPYSVMSDRLVDIAYPNLKATSLNWDATINDYRRDFPNEKVEFVTAHAVRKWLVPVRSIESKKK